MRGLIRKNIGVATHHEPVHDHDATRGNRRIQAAHGNRRHVLHNHIALDSPQIITLDHASTRPHAPIHHQQMVARHDNAPVPRAELHKRRADLPRMRERHDGVPPAGHDDLVPEAELAHLDEPARRGDARAAGEARRHVGRLRRRRGEHDVLLLYVRARAPDHVGARAGGHREHVDVAARGAARQPGVEQPVAREARAERRHVVREEVRRREGGVERRARAGRVVPPLEEERRRGVRRHARRRRRARAQEGGLAQPAREGFLARDRVEEQRVPEEAVERGGRRGRVDVAEGRDARVRDGGRAGGGVRQEREGGLHAARLQRDCVGGREVELEEMQEKEKREAVGEGRGLGHGGELGQVGVGWGVIAKGIKWDAVPVDCTLYLTTGTVGMTWHLFDDKIKFV